MWDAYPTNDLRDTGMLISMVHRSNQAGDPPEDYAPYLPLLPEATRFYPLKGGTHLTFGNFIPGRIYRDEAPAELDPPRQRALAAVATSETLRDM